MSGAGMKWVENGMKWVVNGLSLENEPERAKQNGIGWKRTWTNPKFKTTDEC